MPAKLFALAALKDEAAAQDTSVLAETLSGPSTPSSPKSVSPPSPVLPRLVRAQGTSSRRVGESSLVLCRRGKEKERSIGFARPPPGRPIAADAGGESERADLPRSRPPQLGSALCMAHVAISSASAGNNCWLASDLRATSANRPCPRLPSCLSVRFNWFSFPHAARVDRSLGSIATPSLFLSLSPFWASTSRVQLATPAQTRLTLTDLSFLQRWPSRVG